MSESFRPWVLLPPRGPNDLNMAEVVGNAIDYAAHRDLSEEWRMSLVLLTAKVAEKIEAFLWDDEFLRVRVQAMRTPVGLVDCIPGGSEPVAAISHNLAQISVKDFEACDEELVGKLARGVVEIIRANLTDDVEYFIYMPYILLVMHSTVLGGKGPFIPLVTRFGMFTLRKKTCYEEQKEKEGT